MEVVMSKNFQNIIMQHSNAGVSNARIYCEALELQVQMLTEIPFTSVPA
jgi:hypothetical protein